MKTFVGIIEINSSSSIKYKPMDKNEISWEEKRVKRMMKLRMPIFRYTRMKTTELAEQPRKTGKMKYVKQLPNRSVNFIFFAYAFL